MRLDGGINILIHREVGDLDTSDVRLLGYKVMGSSPTAPEYSDHQFTRI